MPEPKFLLLLYKAKFTQKWVKNCQFRPKNALIDLKISFIIYLDDFYDFKIFSKNPRKLPYFGQKIVFFPVQQKFIKIYNKIGKKMYLVLKLLSILQKHNI